MDDELLRRLRAADPLAVGTGVAPDPARLDATRERIVMDEHQPPAGGPATRPGRGLAVPAGLGAVGALAVAAILVAGQFARPAPALAFDGTPTPVTDAQRAAAQATCTEAIEDAGTDPSVRIRLAPDGPAALPPLAALELHGTGAVAVFADASAVGICMLVADGDGWVRGPVVLGSTAAAGPGSAEPNVFGGLVDGTAIVVVGGTAPAGAVTMRLEGGPADGATASVQGGGYGIWVPGDAYYPAPDLVALDASGTEIWRTSLEVQGKGDGPVPNAPGRSPSP